MSNSLLNPSLDFFSEPLSDESIENKEYQVYNPNDIGVPGTTKTRFEIIVNPQDVFQNFSDARLEVQLKLQKADGTAIAGDTALQSGFWSLWEKAELRVGNGATAVETVNFANVASQMKYLTESTPEYTNTSGENMGIYLDKGTSTPVPADNSGFSKRVSLATGTMTFYCDLKHLFGYCTNGKVTRALRHTVILTRANHANMVHQASAVTDLTKVHINHVKLWVPNVLPNLQIISDFESKMAQGFSSKISYESMNCYRSGVFQADDLTPVYRVTTSIANPTAIIVGVQNSDVDLSYNQTNQCFNNARIEQFEIRLNNTQFPRERLETSYAEPNNYGRAYKMFQEYHNKFGDNHTGSNVNLADFKNIYNLYVMDLKHIPPTVFSTNNQADVEIRLRKNSAHNSPLHIYCLIMSETELVVSGTSGEIRVEKL